MSESDDTQFRIRVYLPTGYTCTLQLYGKTTFAELRHECWTKKSKDFGCSKSDARFRLYTTEMFFNDNHTISYLVSIYPSFEGLGQIDRYSILLQCPSQLGDKTLRDKMKVDGKKPIFWQGYLFKCSKATGKGFWKKQYVVFQNQTLMLYATQDEFSKGKKAHKYIGMGSLIPQLDHHSCKTANKKWPFVFDVPVGQGTKAGIMVFAGDSQAVRASFIQVVSKHLFFRKCAMVLNILSCLYNEDYVSTQGIFRIAGESTKIKQYQEQIDHGIIPHFAHIIQLKTIHNFTGLLKRQLRFMISPIIPETHYEAFIDIGRLLTLDKRIEQLNFVIKSLSSTSVLVLAELCRFLNYAVQFESKSKMDATNFAIVIGPNILRSAQQELTNPMKAIDDNKHMQTTISTMISYYMKILPDMNDLYKFDRATNTKWKYGVIDNSMPQTQIKSVHSTGLFELTQNLQGVNNNNNNVLNSEAMRQFSKSTSMIPKKQMQMKQDALHGVKLKKSKSPKNIAPQSSLSNNVDFRAVLKKSKDKGKGKVKDDMNHSYHSHVVDFRAQMKQKRKPNLNKNLKQNSNEHEEVDLDEKKEDLMMNSPKSPPPNPIEVMSADEKRKQKENTVILEVFQDFEDNMAQYDEEIDFKQSFAESLVSQIMGLAENNNVISAGKYKKEINSKCRLVINAAKAHSQALQTFNQMLQNIYGQMEDELERESNKNNHGGHGGGGISGIGPSTNSSANTKYTTPGGPSEGGDGGDDDDGGLPQRIPTNYDFEQQDDTEIKSQYDQATVAAAMSGGLPRYQSARDAAKSNEPEKKVAKALFDYPGGYRSNELTFHRGTSLIIAKEKEGWVYGYYELEPSLTGWFPKSYVKIISG